MPVSATLIYHTGTDRAPALSHSTMENQKYFSRIIVISGKRIIQVSVALVAELADAPASGAGGRKAVMVQLHSRALRVIRGEPDASKNRSLTGLMVFPIVKECKKC